MNGGKYFQTEPATNMRKTAKQENIQGSDYVFYTFSSFLSMVNTYCRKESQLRSYFDNKKHLIENGLFNLKVEEMNHFPGSLLFRGKYKYPKLSSGGGGAGSKSSVDVIVKINKDKESAWKLLSEYWTYREKQPDWNVQVPAYIFIDGAQCQASSF